MKITDLNQQIENVNLDKPTKKAIFALLDLKIENDMEKILKKMEVISARTETRITMLFWFIGALGILITILKFIA